MQPAHIAPMDRETVRFDMEKLRDFRFFVQEILKSAALEHTQHTLRAMRSACDPNDKQMCAKFDFIERKLQDNAPGRPRLHVEVLASIVAAIRMCKPETILDIGCGEGMLLMSLASEPYVKKLVGLDIDPKEVKQAQALIDLMADDREDLTIEVREADATSWESKQEFSGWDIVVLSEVIEHIPDKNWIREIFGLDPRVLIVTTPNKEFNALYDQKHLQPNGLRHTDHDFEFTRAEFSDWAHELAKTNGYHVDLLPIGPANIPHGSASQMAIFQKR